MSEAYNVKFRLLAAFRHLLVPLIRILVRNGISFDEFAEVGKTVFAQVAAREFLNEGKRLSHSRVAIVTGLTRKEVSRIFTEEDRLKKALESNANRVARVLQGWHTDPEFMGPYGFPRDLAFDGTDAGGANFTELVRRYSGDMPPRAMFDELMRVRAVTVVEESKLIRVLKRTYIPEQMAPELIEVFARGVRRYVETIEHNTLQKESHERRFERWVFPDYGVRAQDWVPFRDMVNDRLQEVIEDLDMRFGLFARPAPADEVITAGVGLYLYREDPSDSKELAALFADMDGDEDRLPS